MEQIKEITGNRFHILFHLYILTIKKLRETRSNKTPFVIMRKASQKKGIIMHLIAGE